MYAVVKLAETPKPNTYLVQESGLGRVPVGARVRVRRHEDGQVDWLLVEGVDEAYTGQLDNEPGQGWVFRVTGIAQEECRASPHRP